MSFDEYNELRTELSFVARVWFDPDADVPYTVDHAFTVAKLAALDADNERLHRKGRGDRVARRYITEFSR